MFSCIAVGLSLMSHVCLSADSWPVGKFCKVVLYLGCKNVHVHSYIKSAECCNMRIRSESLILVNINLAVRYLQMSVRKLQLFNSQ